jgi:hypothetical protein
MGTLRIARGINWWLEMDWKRLESVKTPMRWVETTRERWKLCGKVFQMTLKKFMIVFQGWKFAEKCCKRWHEISDCPSLDFSG